MALILTQTPHTKTTGGGGSYLREMQADPRLCYALTSVHEVLAETEEVCCVVGGMCGLCMCMCV